MRRTISALTLASALALLPVVPALAHGDHTQGDLIIVTGFAVEPAYAGQPNGVQLRIKHDGAPVTDLKPNALSVDVSFGDQTTTLTLVAAFEVGEWGTPGDYRADFIPSQPGAYTFHVTGTVQGEDVDYEMASGPDAFSEVLDPAAATFPQVDAPSNADLAARAEQEAARTAEVASSVTAAQDAADSARLIAIAAAVVAIVAIGLAIAARGRARGGEAAA